jgi:hypothetical protein
MGASLAEDLLDVVFGRVERNAEGLRDLDGRAADEDKRGDLALAW